MTRAQAAYSVKAWNRKKWTDEPAGGATGASLIRIEMSSVYQGDIEGESAVQYLVADNGDRRGHFVALEKVTGRVGDRSGSFLFQHTGTFDNGKIRSTLVVVPGSGTGDLSGLSGQATLELDDHQESNPITFDYEM